MEVKVNLGGGESKMTVTVTGSDCRLEDTLMALVDFLRKRKADYDNPPPGKKPCPCEGKNAD